MLLLGLYYFLWIPLSVMAIKELSMEEHCGEVVSLILEDAYQAKVTLDDPRGGVGQCDVTIESWYTWPRLMVSIFSLQLNCSQGYITFYDGSASDSSVLGPQDKICGEVETRQLLTTTQQFLGIKYVKLQMDVSVEVMEMVVTSFSIDSDHDCENQAFRCDNGRCIDNSLKCNGYNSCGDMSDCRTTVSAAVVAGIVIGSLVGLFVLVAIACYFTCHCRHKHKDNKKKEGESQLVFVQGKTGPNTAVHRPGFAGQAISELSCPGAALCDSVEYSKSLTAAKQPAYLPPWVEARKKSITGTTGTRKVSIKGERSITGFDNPSCCGQGQSNSNIDEDECDQNDIDVNVSKQCQGTNEQTEDNDRCATIVDDGSLTDDKS